jgi:hypothetical protein
VATLAVFFKPFSSSNLRKGSELTLLTISVPLNG